MTIELVVTNSMQQTRTLLLQWGETLKVESGDSVKLTNKTDIKTLRKGNDLVIINKNGEEFVLKDFYIKSEQIEETQLFSWDDTLGQEYALYSSENTASTTSAINDQNTSNSEVTALDEKTAAVAVTTESDDSDRAIAWLFTGEGSEYGAIPVLGSIVGTGAALLSIWNGSSNSDNNTNATSALTAPTLTVNDSDANGYINASGTSEPGSTVNITWPDGSTSSALTDGNGNWSAESPTLQASGTVTATANDANGNTSDPTTANYTDTTAPAAPTLNVNDTDADNRINASGTSEPGSTVNITWPDGSRVQARVDGGTGIDTIQLTAGASLDLLQISNTAAAGDYGTGSRIANIERFDLATDSGANTLTLGLRDVMDMAGMNLFNDGNGWTGLGATVQRHQLVVDGTAADTVNLLLAEGWTLSGSVSNGGNTYNIYNTGTNAGQLVIDNNINTIIA
jgi:hypothetical protein